MTVSSNRQFDLAASRQPIALVGNSASHSGLDFPHALKIGNSVYIGGQMSVGADGEILGPNDIAIQTDNVFKNMVSLLRAAGTDMAELVKLHTYYRYRGNNVGRAATDYWENMTKVRLRYLANPGPAATAVRVEGAPTERQLIGIDGIAIVGTEKRRIMPKHTWDWSIPTPFSQGWRIADKIFVGGQISADMKGRAVAPGDVVTQCRNTLEFIRHVLLAGGGSWSDLVTLKICFKHSGSDREARELLAQILEVCRETIPEPRPAVTAFGVDLLYEGLMLEIDGFAVLGSKTKIMATGSDNWVTIAGFPHAWKAGREIYLGAVSAPGGANMQAQAEASVERLRRVLADAGAGLQHLAKLTAFYVTEQPVDDGERDYHSIIQALGDYLPSPSPVVTIVRVPGLPHDGQRFAIDGIAVLDG